LNKFILTTAAALCLLPALRGPAAAEALCYKATAQMWDAAAGRAAPVSAEVLVRLRRAFALWEEASGGALTLRDSGLSAPGYDGLTSVPYDGCVHAVLYGARNFHGELAHGSFNGAIPGRYKRGYFFVSRSPSAMDAATLIHEIGHTLGLGHSATPASVMFSGPRAWGRGEPAGLPAQDAADLRALWAPEGLKPYSISGVIETAREHPVAFVFAVDARSGRAYSARADHMGRFSLAVPEPGEYKLASKAAEVSMDLLPQARAGMSSSWYVSEGQNAAEQARGAVFALSPASPAVKGLRVKTLDEPAPFALTSAAAEGRADLSSLRPGDEAVISFPEAGGKLASAAACGSAPDYHLYPLPAGGGGRFRLKIFKRAGPGERLICARDRAGKIVLGLVGIQVLKAKE